MRSTRFHPTGVPHKYACECCGRVRHVKNERKYAVATCRCTWGLGDFVAWAIEKITWGQLPQTVKCGCRKRQQQLNRAASPIVAWLRTSVAERAAWLRWHARRYFAGFFR